jgi:sulfur carrier protein ThiS adenylyltransferase
MMAEVFMPSPQLLVGTSGLVGWGKDDHIRIHRVHDSFSLVGDGSSEISEKMPPTSAIACLTTDKQ